MKTRYMILGMSLASFGFAQEEAQQPSAAATPTRFVAGDYESYVAARKNLLLINKNERGPFGLFQVPGSAPVVPQFRKPVKEVETPFADVIRAIPISAVFAAEKEFMVQGRLFRIGQVFPLVAADNEVSVRVESVSTRAVAFKNLDSGELVEKRLDLLPEGITAGTQISSVPGVTPTGGGGAQPLHINVSTPPKP